MRSVEALRFSLFHGEAGLFNELIELLIVKVSDPLLIKHSLGLLDPCHKQLQDELLLITAKDVREGFNLSEPECINPDTQVPHQLLLVGKGEHGGISPCGIAEALKALSGESFGLKEVAEPFLVRSSLSAKQRRVVSVCLRKSRHLKSSLHAYERSMHAHYADFNAVTV